MSAASRDEQRDGVTTAVYIVAGTPGSGKSTFGRALAARRGAVLLDQDVLTNPLMVQIARMAGIADHDLDHPAVAAPDVRHARYQCLLDTALSNIQLGRSVVLVAPFTAEVSRPDIWADTVAPFAPTPVLLLWVSVPSAVATQRRRDRALPRDLAADLAGSPSATPVPAVAHIDVDGTQPTDVALDQLAEQLA